MLLTNSNFEPVSTGCLLQTFLCSYHHLITIIITTSLASTCSYIHHKVKGKFSQRSKDCNSQRKILRQKEESTKLSDKDQSERTATTNVCMTKTKDV